MLVTHKHQIKYASANVMNIWTGLYSVTIIVTTSMSVQKYTIYTCTYYMYYQYNDLRQSSFHLKYLSTMIYSVFHRKLTSLTQHLSKVSNNIQPDIIIMGFAKVVNKVSHQYLLYKISHYGINCNAFNWINNFLQNITKYSPWGRNIK